VEIFCINLRRRREKWRRMQRRFAQQKLSARRVAAIEGRAVDPRSLPPALIALDYDTTQNAAWDPRVRPGVQCRLTAGEIGCILSHLSVWEAVLAERLPRAIVLEDDVDLAPRFRARVEQLLPASGRWDVFYLGYLATHLHPVPRPRAGAARPTQLFGTFGYAISRRGAERLLAQLPVVGPLDVFLSSRFAALDIRCAVPPLVEVQPRSLERSDIVRSAHHAAAARATATATATATARPG
jgi:GR25 family glycosyltransferase involved in LPS biosynthesis